MTKTEVVERIKAVGVIPVVRAPSADDAAQAVEAIAAGGVPIAEITMTVPGAMAVIERLARRFGRDIVLGAGSVLDSEVAHDCVEAGAQFIVTPAVHADTIAFCSIHEVAVVPGALTPTEIVNALATGADLVKVFPASAMGGAGYIKALMAPMPDLQLVPTGGVTLDNVESFIEAGAAAIGVGGDLVSIAALREGRAKDITVAARAYLDAVQKARARHRPASISRYKTPRTRGRADRPE